MRRTALLIGMGLTLVLSACGEPKLRELRAPGEGPDEFRIVPYKPLEQPENYTDLPAPSQGANRVDQNPLSDIAAALGGQATSPTGQIPAADAGIVAYASRAGVNPNIRATLAEEDVAFRKRRARFANIKLFPEDRYETAYQRYELKPHDVANQFRRAGVAVVSAPPERGR